MHVVRATLFIALVPSASLAQEVAPFSEPAGQSPLLAYAAVSLPPDSVQHQVTVEAEATKPPELAPVVDTGWTPELFQRPTQATPTDLDSEFVLLQTRMRSRYAYDSRAAVQAGYGQFFPVEKLGRSRISGAGIREPDWLYLRLSFSF